MTSLLENRKSLYQQIVDSQMQFEAVDAKLQQLQPLANLGMAWAMTAHELNNLLTPIVSYAQLALQNPQDVELSEKALKKAERLSTQAGQMLEKVMTLANAEAAPKQVHVLSALLDGDPAARSHISVEYLTRNISVPWYFCTLRKVLSTVPCGKLPRIDLY